MPCFSVFGPILLFKTWGSRPQALGARSELLTGYIKVKQRRCLGASLILQYLHVAAFVRTTCKSQWRMDGLHSASGRWLLFFIPCTAVELKVRFSHNVIRFLVKTVCIPNVRMRTNYILLLWICTYMLYMDLNILINQTKNDVSVMSRRCWSNCNVLFAVQLVIKAI